MNLIENSAAFPLLISNVVTILLIVFFGRDRYQQQHAFKFQMARLQTKALIAQMNPHFIYNTLNGIQSTMLLKGRKKSIDILEYSRACYARLLRCRHYKRLALMKK